MLAYLLYRETLGDKIPIADAMAADTAFGAVAADKGTDAVRIARRGGEGAGATSITEILGGLDACLLCDRATDVVASSRRPSPSR